MLRLRPFESQYVWRLRFFGMSRNAPNHVLLGEMSLAIVCIDRQAPIGRGACPAKE